MTIPPAGRPDPRRRQPLWDRVDANRLRLVGYLVVFALFSSAALGVLLVVGAVVVAFLEFRFGDPFQEPYAARWFLDGSLWRAFLVGLAGGVCYEWWALSRSERWLLAMLGATFVPKGERLDTKMALKDMAIASGLDVAPALYLVESGSVNAFVYKAPRRRPVLGVTRGLIERLSISEQRAVFANLVARVASGDTLVSSAVASLMTPLQWYREHRLRMLDVEDKLLAEAARNARSSFVIQTADGPVRVQEPTFAPVLLLMPFLFPAILVGEIAAALQRRSQRTAAEKADAEGMLLLKDPQSMLSALQRCIVADNAVEAAGEYVADLFYCWTGLSPDDETDPEWERVARLREVLGVDGYVPS